MGSAEPGPLVRTVVCQTGGCPWEGHRHTVVIPTLQPGLYAMPDLRCVGCMTAPAIVTGSR